MRTLEKFDMSILHQTAKRNQATEIFPRASSAGSREVESVRRSSLVNKQEIPEKSTAAQVLSDSGAPIEDAKQQVEIALTRTALLHLAFPEP